MFVLVTYSSGLFALVLLYQICRALPDCCPTPAFTGAAGSRGDRCWLLALNHYQKSRPGSGRSSGVRVQGAVGLRRNFSFLAHFKM
jgi:hypothetical protein